VFGDCFHLMASNWLGNFNFDSNFGSNNEVRWDSSSLNFNNSNPANSNPFGSGSFGNTGNLNWNANVNKNTNILDQNQNKFNFSFGNANTSNSTTSDLGNFNKDTIGTKGYNFQPFKQTYFENGEQKTYDHQHICMHNQFHGVSAEELRLKDQRDNVVFNNNAKQGVENTQKSNSIFNDNNTNGFDFNFNKTMSSNNVFDLNSNKENINFGNCFVFNSKNDNNLGNNDSNKFNNSGDIKKVDTFSNFGINKNNESIFTNTNFGSVFSNNDASKINNDMSFDKNMNANGQHNIKNDQQPNLFHQNNNTLLSSVFFGDEHKTNDNFNFGNSVVSDKNFNFGNNNQSNENFNFGNNSIYGLNFSETNNENNNNGFIFGNKKSNYTNTFEKHDNPHQINIKSGLKNSDVSTFDMDSIRNYHYAQKSSASLANARKHEMFVSNNRHDAMPNRLVSQNSSMIGKNSIQIARRQINRVAFQPHTNFVKSTPKVIENTTPHTTNVIRPKLIIPKDHIRGSSYYLRQMQDMENNENRKNENKDEHENDDQNQKASHYDAPTLTHEDYYTVPSIEKLKQLTNKQLSEIENFTVGHKMFGKITWIGKTDVRGLNLDELVTIQSKSVEVYKDDSSTIKKPEQGCELNKYALIELHNVWPDNPKNDNNNIDEVYDVKNDYEALERYANKLMKYCSKRDGVEFQEYDMTNGKWVFSVSHFTVYGFENNNDENEN